MSKCVATPIIFNVEDLIVFLPLISLASFFDQNSDPELEVSILPSLPRLIRIDNRNRCK